MSARWLALFCLFLWMAIAGAIAILNVTPNIPAWIPGLLLLVGGIAGLLSLFIAGRSKE